MAARRAYDHWDTGDDMQVPPLFVETARRSKWPDPFLRPVNVHMPVAGALKIALFVIFGTSLLAAFTMFRYEEEDTVLGGEEPVVHVDDSAESARAPSVESDAEIGAEGGLCAAGDFGRKGVGAGPPHAGGGSENPPLASVAPPAHVGEGDAQQPSSPVSSKPEVPGGAMVDIPLALTIDTDPDESKTSESEPVHPLPSVEESHLKDVEASMVDQGVVGATPQAMGQHGCESSAGYVWCESMLMCVRPWETPCPEINSTAGNTTVRTRIGDALDEHGCIGSAGYVWCEKLGRCLRPWEEVCPPSEPLVGSDTDEHGCIGSAGYVWCEKLGRCLRPWEEVCPPSEPLVGSDTDEHGCIGSAGYVWCEKLGRCLRPWEEVCPPSEPLVGSDTDEHGCIGSAGYVWCEKLGRCLRPWEEVCPPSEPLVGSDTDEHGCIGSAGYVWCEKLGRCLRPWEEACPDQSVNELGDPELEVPEDLSSLIMHHLPNNISATDVISLTDETFETHIMRHNLTFVEFFAPWCGHCQRLAPEFERAARMMAGRMPFAKVDATENTQLARQYDIAGFPTLLLFRNGKKDEEYWGDRTAEAITEFLDTQMRLPSEKAADQNVIVLTNATFDEYVTNNPLLLVDFYSPWCHHCQQLAPVYEVVAKMMKGRMPVANVDVMVERDLASRFNIYGVPTVLLFRNGIPSPYNGRRTTEAFVSFLSKELEKGDEIPTP